MAEHGPGQAWRALGRTAPTTGELELLRAAVAPDAIASAAWARWSRTNDIARASWRAQAVLPSVAARHGSEKSSAGEQLRALRRRAWADGELAIAAAGQILDLLTPLPERPILVKGIALATSVYPSPGTRTFGDVDVVVGDRDFVTATELLEAGGWQRGPNFERQASDHSGDLFGPGGAKLDLHRWVLFPRFSRVEEAGLRARAVAHEVAGRPCRRLADADALVLAVVHGLAPGNVSAVRWPLDVARLVASAADPAMWWNAVVASAAELGVGRAVAAGLAMCRAELAIDVPATVINELRSQATDRWLAVDGWCRRHGVHTSANIRRYHDVRRARGQRPGVIDYVMMRLDSLAAADVREVAARRVGGIQHRWQDRRRHSDEW